MRIPSFLRAAVAAVAIAATLGTSTASADDIVLRRDGSKAVPVVTPSEPVTRADGFDWGDAGIGAGILAGLVLLGAAGFLATRHLGKAQTA